MSSLRGNLESVKFLLAAKADTSIPEKDGYTPMHGAGFQGRAEIAKLLIAHGLNPSEKHKAQLGAAWATNLAENGHKRSTQEMPRVTWK